MGHANSHAARDHRPGPPQRGVLCASSTLFEAAFPYSAHTGPVATAHAAPSAFTAACANGQENASNRIVPKFRLVAGLNGSSSFKLHCSTGRRVFTMRIRFASDAPAFSLSLPLAFSLALALVWALLLPRSLSAEPLDCASGPLISKYVKAGLATFSPTGVMTLVVTTDLHDGSSCGAPDCYGTTIRIVMTPVRPGSCTYRNAIVLTEDFDGCNDEFSKFPTGKREESFAADTEFDTRKSDLKELKLLNQSAKRAILVVPWNTFYFDHLPPKFTLRAELEPEYSAGTCCYGAGMTYYQLATADDIKDPHPRQRAHPTEARHGKAHHSKTRHGKARHGKARHGKARHHRRWSRSRRLRTAPDSVFGVFPLPEIGLH